MYETPPLPLLKRVPPGMWTALAWCVAVAYPSVVSGASRYTRGPHAGDAMPTHRDLSLALLASVIAFASCAVLRRLPLTALALLLVASLAATNAWTYGAELSPVPLLAVYVALCLVTATASRRRARAAAAMVFTVLFGHLTLLPELGGHLFLTGRSIGPSDAGLLVAVIAWLAGRSMRQSRDHAEMLGAHAATQAVTAERLRIARELHDMVAHSIGIIALQSGAARRVIDTQPARAREALGEIETASRETLSGLRRMLGALRQGESDTGAEEVPLHRMPGLADLDRLAAATTAAGVRVDVHWQGERRALPPDVDLSAFRIVQEAVTNVVRHAGSGSCQVSIDCREDELAIEIVDGGRGRGSGTDTGTGYGLAGLRERVALLHGEFSAGPRPEGGFQVAARLPVPTGVR
ncbi:sensor histidine kinase [Kitasatospora sp. HPMI-4]|uniref:sensor histidine kinase n=1 Tax=Kitasatospora sp. HPMI-4 TaxID=3448443 RepID=UPI003F1B6913